MLRPKLFNKEEIKRTSCGSDSIILYEYSRQWAINKEKSVLVCNKRLQSPHTPIKSIPLRLESTNNNKLTTLKKLLSLLYLTDKC